MLASSESFSNCNNFLFSVSTQQYLYNQCFLLRKDIERGADVNCEPMSDNFQVAWKIDGEYINFDLAGNIGKPTDIVYI